MDLLRSELKILEYVVVQPKDLLGTVLAVLITVQEMHTVLVLTEGETAAEFFCTWAKENGILRAMYLVSMRAEESVKVSDAYNIYSRIRKSQRRDSKKKEKE